MRGLKANPLRERRTVLQDDPPIRSTITAIERLGSDRFARTPLLLGPLPLKRETPKWGSCAIEYQKRSSSDLPKSWLVSLYHWSA
jgi:hypothetical protein